MIYNHGPLDRPSALEEKLKHALDSCLQDGSFPFDFVFGPAQLSSFLTLKVGSDDYNRVQQGLLYLCFESESPRSAFDVLYELSVDNCKALVQQDVVPIAADFTKLTRTSQARLIDLFDWLTPVEITNAVPLIGSILRSLLFMTGDLVDALCAALNKKAAFIHCSMDLTRCMFQSLAFLGAFSDDPDVVTTVQHSLHAIFAGDALTAMFAGDRAPSDLIALAATVPPTVLPNLNDLTPPRPAFTRIASYLLPQRTVKYLQFMVDVAPKMHQEITCRKYCAMFVDQIERACRGDAKTACTVMAAALRVVCTLFPARLNLCKTFIIHHFLIYFMEASRKFKAPRLSPQRITGLAVLDMVLFDRADLADEKLVVYNRMAGAYFAFFHNKFRLASFTSDIVDCADVAVENLGFWATSEGGLASRMGTIYHPETRVRDAVVALTKRGVAVAGDRVIGGASTGRVLTAAGTSDQVQTAVFSRKASAKGPNR